MHRGLVRRKFLYYTVNFNIQKEIIIKKSKFIANIKHIENENEARSFLAEIKKLHPNCKHYVYAYIAKNGFQKFSDDGEPHGTGGVPILNLLLKRNLRDVMIIVSRYFGGVLLGKTGLLRAYSSAAKLVIESSEIKEIKSYKEFQITCDYKTFDKFKKEMTKFKCSMEDVKYKEIISFKVFVPVEYLEEFKENVKKMGENNVEISDSN